jgi:hypothetical protein
MLDAEAIQKIVELGKHEVAKIEGFDFHVSAKGAVPLQFPQPDIIKVFSLNQAVSAIKAMIGADEKLIVNVLDSKTIEVMSEKRLPNGRIQVLIQAQAKSIFEEFNQSQTMDHEEFLIELMSKFAPSPDRDLLLKLTSVVTDDSAATTSDNGVSQTVAVKKGVAFVESETLKPIWQLRPFRTFPEIEQPLVPFLFRVHKGPEFSLRDCDGGQWKVTTTAKIRGYLEDNLKDLKDKVKVL